MFAVTYNGYTIEHFDTADQVEAYINKTLEPYKHLEPREIYRSYGDDNKATGKAHTDNIIKSVIIFQYRTIYTEVFMIEQRSGF